jgi:transcriptional regulator with XRE-family HTH domain
MELNDPMHARRLLWANLCRLVGSDHTIQGIARKLGVPQATIQRIRKASVSTGIDIVQSLADALGVEVWELLAPPGATQRLSAEAMAIAAAFDALPNGNFEEISQRRWTYISMLRQLNHAEHPTATSPEPTHAAPPSAGRLRGS